MSGRWGIVLVGARRTGSLAAIAGTEKCQGRPADPGPELGDQKVNEGDQAPWSRATIKVSSVKTARTDPFIEFRPPHNGKYLRISVRTHVTEGPFTLSKAHFALVSPAGKTFDQDENVTYRPDHFRDLNGDDGQNDSARGPEPGSGVILYDVPATGVPHGTRVEATLFKGQTFAWTLP